MVSKPGAWCAWVVVNRRWREREPNRRLYHAGEAVSHEVLFYPLGCGGNVQRRYGVTTRNVVSLGEQADVGDGGSGSGHCAGRACDFSVLVRFLIQRWKEQRVRIAYPCLVTLPGRFNYRLRGRVE